MRIAKQMFSWEEFDKACEVLAENIKSKINITPSTRIYGIPRGGLIMAVKLSHLLNIRLTLDPYDADLIVDEIYDTGKTIKRLKLLPNGDKKVYAVIHTKNKRAKIDFWVHYTKRWVVYPWEVKKDV